MGIETKFPFKLNHFLLWYFSYYEEKVKRIERNCKI